MVEAPVAATVPLQISTSSSLPLVTVRRFTADQSLTPPPETLLTGNGVELLVLTVSTSRSPWTCGDTARLVPVPAAKPPTAEITGTAATDVTATAVAMNSTPTASSSASPLLVAPAGCTV